MKKELRELKEMYENMVESANDPVMLIDKDGYFPIVNRKFCELSGYSPEEIGELHYSKLVHPDDLEMVQDRHERRFAGEDVPQNYRFKVLRKNGEILHIDFNASAIKKKGKVVAIHAIARDITKRKEAEEALRESEEIYRTLVKTSPDAVTVTDLKGNITFVSNRTLEVHGFEKAEELIGKSAFELIAPENHEEAMINLKKTLKEGFLRNLEYTLLRKDGTSFIGELNTALIKDAYGKPKAFIATTRDVTERKRTEEALREEKRRYRALFERTNDAVFIINLEGIHLEVNQQAADMLGYKIDEIVGRSFKDFISPNEYKDADAKKKALLAGKTLPVYDRTFRRKDGTEFPAEINIALVYDDKGKPLHFHSVVRDITERKQAEEALQRNEEKYRTILENIEDGYYEVDIAGNFTFFNDSLCRLLGYPKDELMGMNNRQYMDRETAKIVYKTFNKIYRTGKPTKVSGWEIIRKDGTRRFIEGSVSLISDSTGKPVGFRGIVRDITERRQTEEKLSAIYELGKRMTVSLNIGDIWEAVVETASKVLELEYFGLSLVDEDRNELYVKDFFGFDEEVRDLRFSLEEDIGITAHVAKTGKAYYSEDVSEDKYYYNASHGTRSEFCVPLKIGKKVIGVINAESTRLDAFDEGDKRLLEALASQAAVAIENARFYERLKGLKEFNEKIIQTMNEGIWVEDSEGFCTFANPRLVKMMGYSDATELLGKHWREMVHPKEAEHVRKETDKRPLGISSSYETILLAKDGREVPALVSATPMFENGKYIGTTAVQVNMTEQKELEREIKKTKDYLESLLESTIDAIVTTDEHGRITFFSKGAEEIFGYKSKEIIGEHVSNYYLGGKEEAIKIMKLLSSKGRLRNYELEIKASDRIVYASSSISLLKDDKGEIVGTLGVIRDVTEEKKVREKLEAIYDLSRKMTLSLNLDEVLETALNVVHDVLNFNLISISLVDEEREEIYIKIQKGYPEKFKNLRFPLYGERGIITWVAREGKPLIVPDVSKDKRYVEADQNIKSELAVPMKVGEKILGVLNVESEDFNAFSEEDKRLLETLASRTAVAIENAKLHEREKEHSKMLEEKVLKKTKKTEALLETSFKLREETSWERGLQVILEGITKGLGFDNAYLFLVNERRGILECEANISNYQELAKVSIPLNDEGYISIQCLREKKPINIKDAFKDERVKKQIGREIKAFAWIPLLAKDEVLGLIAVDNEESGREITKEDIDSLVLFANQSAIFIDKMRYLVEPAIEKRLPTKLKYDLSSMESYLILEERSEKSFAIFVDMVTHGIQGFCVSRMHPKVLKRRYGLKKTPMIWLSNIGVRESIDSQDLGKMTHIVSEFLKRAQDSVVLLEGVEYLITENSFERVLKMLHSLNDQIMITNARLLLPLNPKTLSEREFNILKKDFRVLEVS